MVCQFCCGFSEQLGIFCSQITKAIGVFTHTHTLTHTQTLTHTHSLSVIYFPSHTHTQTQSYLISKKLGKVYSLLQQCMCLFCCGFYGQLGIFYSQITKETRVLTYTQTHTKLSFFHLSCQITKKYLLA